jgi:hypothetical protein
MISSFSMGVRFLRESQIMKIPRAKKITNLRKVMTLLFGEAG